MKLRNIITLTICLLTYLSSGQSSDKVISMYKQMNTHIDKMESKGEGLFFMYCDVIAEGHIQKYGIVNLKKEAKYNFFIEVTDDVIEAEFVLLDSTEATIKKATIVGGQKRKFSVSGYNGVALIGMKGLKFKENRLLGFYGLSITNRPSKPMERRKLKVVDNTPDTGVRIDNETDLLDLSEDCSYGAIKGLKFKTTEQYTQREGEEKTGMKKYKSSISIDGSISKLTQKIKRRKDVYTVIKKGCTSGGAFKLIVDNDSRYRFIVTIDKNRNLFSIQPEGSSSATIYDMTKIKN